MTGWHKTTILRSFANPGLIIRPGISQELTERTICHDTFSGEKNMSQPINLGDLLLRRPDFHDRDELLKLYSHSEVCRYQFFQPLNLQQVDELIHSQSQVKAGDPGVAMMFVIWMRASNKVVGDCQINVTDPASHQGEVGFSLHPDYWGKGIATRSVEAIINFAFDTLKLHRITAATDVRNERSWRLMERLAMRREAHFINDHFENGEWIDDFVYAILDEEWRQRKVANSSVELS